MKRSKLSIKALIGFLFLAIILILCTCSAVGIQYWQGRMNEYKELAFSYTRTAAEYIDGDKVLSYLETGIEDDYYRQVKSFLNTTQEQSDLKYYYVFVPYEDDLVYVWDADMEEGACPLGYHENYMEGGKEAVSKIYKQNPPENILITKDEVYGYIAAAYSPIFNSDGEPVAVVGVDLSMSGIRSTLFGFIWTIILNVFVVITIFNGIFYVFFRRKIIKPIKQLDYATKKMVGNLQSEERFEIDIHSGDEIEDLANAFVTMDSEIRNYIQKLSRVTAEKERIGAELDVATHIQSSMLPCIFPPFPERNELDIYATMNPAKEVGGDFYDFFMVDDKHLAIVMADVSGKGVPAALFMVIGKTLIKDHTQPGKDLGEVFTEVNNLLCESNSEGMFITAFEGVLNLETGEFSYVNAGHEIPFVCNKDGLFEPYKVRAGFVLAGMENIRYKSGSIQMKPGDKIFQYTDGVTEATNEHEELYGMNHLTEVLCKNAASSPMQLLTEVKADIDAFVGDAPQFDDITMLCLEYKKQMKNTEG